LIHLKSLKLDRHRWESPDQYPFNLPIVQSINEIEFRSEVTFLVGENGSGKSTFIEAVACAVGSIAVGSESVQTDKNLAPVRKLAKDLRLVWNKRTHAGFFMRTEDFFGFSKKISDTREEYLSDLE